MIYTFLSQNPHSFTCTAYDTNPNKTQTTDPLQYHPLHPLTVPRRGEALVVAVTRPLHGDARGGRRAQGGWDKVAVRAPGLDVLRRRPGRQQEPSRRGRAFVPRPPSFVPRRGEALVFAVTRPLHGDARGGGRTRGGWGKVAVRAPGLNVLRRRPGP